MSIILQPHVEERLRSDAMAWLTTVRPDGHPHSIPLWFLWERTTILIFSQANTQKIRNLRQNAFVTLTLDNTKNGSDVVILEGTASLSELEKERASLPAYDEKYREGLSRLGLTAELFTRKYSQPIRLTPIRLITGR